MFKDREFRGNFDGNLGGVLMGFGGVTAMGYTVGQGITGFSTLALCSMLTFFPSSLAPP